MRRIAILVAVVLSLAVAGGASAYALRTIFLKPGHCTKVHGTKVCARQVKPRTIVATVTVAPSPVGQTFSGNGDETLAPVTLTHGVTVSWTAQPDSDGINQFEVSSGPNDENFIEFDNGDSSTSGTSFVPPGTYTFDVSASAAWTLSF
ncbi:MAG TPA: hypothetical protein VFU30_09125 [Gaiellaceae bacterium]|nr:hypothetical protein [Gaiellaceae bacterium]